VLRKQELLSRRKRRLNSRYFEGGQKSRRSGRPHCSPYLSTSSLSRFDGRQVTGKRSTGRRTFSWDPYSRVRRRVLQRLRDGVLLMLRIVGLCIAITVGVLMVVNAGFMLASPRAWFQLPGWIRAQGSLTEEKYGGGWGAAQIRITGAVMLAAVVWVLYELLARRR
jgi:hypothetical protein